MISPRNGSGSPLSRRRVVIPYAPPFQMSPTFGSNFGCGLINRRVCVLVPSITLGTRRPENMNDRMRAWLSAGGRFTFLGMISPTSTSV